jgi:hypothetical protein
MPWPIYSGTRCSVDIKALEYLGDPLLVLSLLGQRPSSINLCDPQKECEAVLRADLNYGLRRFTRCLFPSTKNLN